MAPTALAATVSGWEAVVDNWDIMCHRVINQINSPGGDRFARNECNILGMTETDPERTPYYALLLSSVWFGHDPRAAWTHKQIREVRRWRRRAAAENDPGALIGS